MAHLRWRLPACLAVAALFCALPTAAPACPFCVDERGPTMVGDYAQASMVLYGHFANPKLDANGDPGSSEFVIEKVLKSHALIEGKKSVMVPKAVPGTKSKFVIFCDVYKTSIEPYRGEEVPPGSQLVEYLSASLAHKDDPLPKRLRHYFDFLNSPDINVSTDAYREYAKADYADYREMAKTLPADTIARWLEDPKTPAYRYGLYASLLGHCGESKKHGDLLRSILNDPRKRMGSGIDGMMAGYLLLQPKEGWTYLTTVLKDGTEDFYVRYAGLRTLRWYWENRNDVVSRDQVLKGMALAISNYDLADFGIDDLRHWERWHMTDTVLDLFTQKSHDHPLVKRAILRFALTSQEKRAVAFVREQRLRDPNWVRDTEELMKYEAPPAKK